MSSTDVAKMSHLAQVEMVEEKGASSGSPSISRLEQQTDGNAEERVTPKAWLCIFVSRPNT